MKFFFIINGRKDKAIIGKEVGKQLRMLAPSFEEWNDQVDVYITTGEGDATRFVRLYCDLHPAEETCFIACGGDGTINEVASGLVGFPNKSMSAINIGGNSDFVKYFPDRDFKSIHDILAGEIIALDIIKVNDSYSLNVADVGFDADVSSFADEYSLLGKKNPFKRGIARALLFSRYNKISVIADGKKLGNRLLLCILANGRIYGDGMLCAPKASMTDGLIDVIFLRPMLLWRFLCSLPTYIRGEHLESLWFKHKIIYCQAKHIDIESKGDLINIGLDGEVVPGTKFSVDILPKAINFRLPKLKGPAAKQ